jgi:predicted secreted protein
MVRVGINGLKMKMKLVSLLLTSADTTVHVRQHFCLTGGIAAVSLEIFFFLSIFNSVGLFLNTLPFSKPHKKKASGVASGDRAA